MTRGGPRKGDDPEYNVHAPPTRVTVLARMEQLKTAIAVGSVRAAELSADLRRQQDRTARNVEEFAGWQKWLESHPESDNG